MSRITMNPKAAFSALFDELLATRARYESLRISGAPFSERVEALDTLQTLRHDMGMLRRGLI